MPKNFKEAKTEVLQFAKRNTEDTRFDTLAGNIINEAIVKTQRLIPNLNAISKVYPNFTYTANADSMSFSDQLYETDINKIIHVEETELGEWEGKPLRVLTYEQFAEERTEHEEHKVASYYNEDHENFSPQNRHYSYQDYISRVFGRISVIIGTDLRLFPVPSQDVNLSIYYTPWLPKLVEDSDTNILLKRAWDFILFSSLVKLNFFLSETDRIEISSSLLSISLNEIKEWNKSLKYSNPVEM